MILMKPTIFGMGLEHRKSVVRKVKVTPSQKMGKSP